MAPKSIDNLLNGRQLLFRKVLAHGFNTLYSFIEQSPYLSLFLVIFGVVLSPVAVVVVASSLMLALIAFSTGLAGGVVFAPLLVIALGFAATTWATASAGIGLYRGLSDKQRARLVSLFGLGAGAVLTDEPTGLSDEVDMPLPESVRELRDRFSAYASTLPELKGDKSSLDVVEPEPLTTARYHELVRQDDFGDNVLPSNSNKHPTGFKVSFSPEVVSHLPMDHSAEQNDVKKDEIIYQESE